MAGEENAPRRSLMEIAPQIEAWAAEQSKEDLHHRGAALGFAIGSVYDAEEVMGKVELFREHKRRLLAQMIGYAEGGDLYSILCIWVHGYKKGVGNRQKRGLGTALLQAAEEDAKALGAKGMTAWGVSLPFFMRAAWFRKHGYLKADNNGSIVLLWKPFEAGAVPPLWIREKKRPEAGTEKPRVTAFHPSFFAAGNRFSFQESSNSWNISAPRVFSRPSIPMVRC